MPITLRTANNPNTDVQIFAILASCLNQFQGVYNTYLAQISVSQTAAELCFIQNKYKLSQSISAAIPYAVHIASGPQRYMYSGGPRNRAGTLTAIIEYCGRWDTQASSVDTIRATIAADLERMKANLENNDSLNFGGQAYVWSMPSIALSEYKGELDTQFTGMTLIQRVMTINMQILPFDC